MTSSNRRDGDLQISERFSSERSSTEVTQSVSELVSGLSLRDRIFRGQVSRTFSHKLLDFPQLETEEDESGRKYLTPSGKLPSVTTILGNTESQEWIKEWYDRVGAERAEAITREGSERGTYVHSMIERYLSNESIQKDSENPSYFWTFKRVQTFLDRISTIYLLESTVFSSKYGFAGRIDCCGDFDGVLSTIDFKNYSAEKTKDQLETAFCQTALYAEGIEEQTTMMGTPLAPSNLVVIFSSQKGRSQVRVEPRSKYRERALERVAEYYRQKRNP